VAEGLAVLAFFLTRRHGDRWLLLLLSATIPGVAFAGDLNAGLAAFLAIGITVAGAVAFGRRWWPTYALIAAGALLVLVLAPDAYAAFGLIFGVTLLAALAWGLFRQRKPFTEIIPSIS
jgi:hypothetical protein